MKTRILAVTRTICALALAVTLCVMPARSVRGDGPLPNIWINLFSLDSTYLGQPVPVDAQIVVFDPQTGVQCGQFAVTHAGWYGTMPCYGDDVGPTAVTLHDLRANAQGLEMVWMLFVLGLLGLLATGFFLVGPLAGGDRAHK
jgi:hypothetical protein